MTVIDGKRFLAMAVRQLDDEEIASLIKLQNFLGKVFMSIPAGKREKIIGKLIVLGKLEEDDLPTAEEYDVLGEIAQ